MSTIRNPGNYYLYFSFILLRAGHFVSKFLIFHSNCGHFEMYREGLGDGKDRWTLNCL